MTWPGFDLQESKARKGAGKGTSRVLCMLCTAPCFGDLTFFVTWAVHITSLIKYRDIGGSHVVSVSCALGTCTSTARRSSYPTVACSFRLVQRVEDRG